MSNEETPTPSDMDGEEPTIDRRELFVRTGALAALGGMAMMPGGASAQENADKSWNVNAKLIEAASHCVKESEICIAHCVNSFQSGSLMLAKCSGLTLETIATCEALTKLGALGTPTLKDMARLCIDSCTRCEAECKLHAGHHEECKRCAESCRACIDECEKLVAN
jgi:Cys-rich four helix bundle protein (predicted Tat secretion target)